MYDWLKFHISNHSIFNHLFSCQLKSILFMRDIVWFVDALSIQVYCDWSSRLSLESLKRSHRNLTINMYEAVSFHTKQRSGLLNVDSLPLHCRRWCCYWFGWMSLVVKLMLMALSTRVFRFIMSTHELEINSAYGCLQSIPPHKSNIGNHPSRLFIMCKIELFSSRILFMAILTIFTHHYSNHVQFFSRSSVFPPHKHVCAWLRLQVQWISLWN